MKEDLLLPVCQKLYAALASLERFGKGQDLYDNIACIRISLLVLKMSLPDNIA